MWNTNQRKHHSDVITPQLQECSSFTAPYFGCEALLLGILQELLQRPPDWHPLLRLAVRDHISAPLCSQLEGWLHLLTVLQTCLCDIPTKVHLHLLQIASMSHDTLQAAVGNVDAVLKVQVAQFPAALQHRNHIVVSDVSTAGQG